MSQHPIDRSDPPVERLCTAVIQLCHKTMEADDTGPIDVFEGVLAALVLLIRGAARADAVEERTDFAGLFIEQARQVLTVVDEETHPALPLQ